MAVKWLQPKKDFNSGYLIHKQSTGAIVKNFDGVNGRCGWETAAYWKAPLLSGNYECSDYTYYIKFDISNITNVSECLFYIWNWANAGAFAGDNPPNYVDVDIYVKNGKNTSNYPWDILELEDYSTPWTKVGTLANIKTLLDSNGIWSSIDLTTQLQDAITAEWEWFAVRFIPSVVVPTNWSYTVPPTKYIGDFEVPGTEEKCYIMFEGHNSTIDITTLPGTYETDTGNAWCFTNPWLKVTTSTPPEPVYNNVLCIAADAKYKLCLAATNSGSLWKIWNDGSWKKERIRFWTNDKVTAIYIDPTRNFKDWPPAEYEGPNSIGGAIVWIGLDSGYLFVSKDSLHILSMCNYLGEKIIEIRGSEIDYNKVVIAHGKKLEITRDCGTTFATKTFDYDIKGIFVRSNDIQVVCQGQHVYRSPDFNVTWYACSIIPTGAVDVAFNLRNKFNSFVVGEGIINVYESGYDSFIYTPGASINGDATVATADLGLGMAYIGTTTKLYKTIDWGETVREIKTGINVTDIAVGGDYLYQV